MSGQLAGLSLVDFSVEVLEQWLAVLRVGEMEGAFSLSILKLHF